MAMQGADLGEDVASAAGAAANTAAIAANTSAIAGHTTAITALQSAAGTDESTITALQATAPTAGQKAGLGAALPVPSATNPALTADALLSPANGTSVYTAVNAGQNAEILAAPAAGFYNLVRYVHVINLSAIATGGYQIKESGSRVIMGSTTVALAASGAASVGGQVVAGALTGFATGTGNLLFIVSYSKIPVGNIGFYQAVLMDTYQTLFTVTAGFSATWAWNLLGAFSGELQCMNVDTLSATPVFRITRGSNAYLRTNSAVGANTRVAQSNLPDVLNGDVIECKCAVAPTAGTVVLSGIYALVPVTS